jgi:hypothetical protein
MSALCLSPKSDGRQEEKRCAGFVLFFFNKKSDSLALDDGVAHLFYALAR